MRAGLALVLLALVLPASAAARSLPDLPVVTTLAGNGQAGIVDGPAARAEFLGPQGIAYDRRGRLDIADTPAQRIRRLAGGVVTTVAGGGRLLADGFGVAGGYRNGPARAARFDDPTGVAVGPHGTLYVADEGNHAIRAIRSGRVTTLTGSPQRRRDRDGTLATAGFAHPRAIAVDARGTLYVADPPDGVRRVDPRTDRVTTLHGEEFDGAWNLAIDRSGAHDDLVLDLPTAVGVYDLATRRLRWGYGTQNLYEYDNEGFEIPTQGAEFAGPASAVAALDPNRLVFTDPLFSSVHYLVHTEAPEYWYTRVLGRQPRLDASVRGGGFRDGPGRDAEYRQPMGIAIAPDGTIAVADTGNRRIRALGPFDQRTFETVGRALPEVPSSTLFRIAIVGNSYVWANMAWHDSLSGVARDRLCAALNRPGSRCPVEVYPIRFDGVLFPDEVNYARSVLADGLVNEVVLDVNSSGFLSYRQPPDINVHDRFIANVTPLLIGLHEKMRAGGTRLVVVLHPDAWDVPNEMSYRKLFTGARAPAAVARSYALLLHAVRASGVAYVDLWPAFFANDAQAGFRPLFGAWDHHFTAFGNALVGGAIAADAWPHVRRRFDAKKARQSKRDAHRKSRS